MVFFLHPCVPSVESRPRAARSGGVWTAYAVLEEQVANESVQISVLYPSLRVSLPEGKKEIVGNLPPGSIGPSSMEALNLQIDGYLSPDLAAE
jgi:hypothetical protein